MVFILAAKDRFKPCSIFIASSTTSGWPAATVAPTSAFTATTRPFIGATSLPSLVAPRRDGSMDGLRRKKLALPRDRCAGLLLQPVQSPKSACAPAKSNVERKFVVA